MNFASVARFIRAIDAELETCAREGRDLAYASAPGRRGLTNSAFLLGAYLVLRHGLAAEAVWRRFQGIDTAALEEYRDASPDPPDFRLRLVDCWAGLARARGAGWVAMPSPARPGGGAGPARA